MSNLPPANPIKPTVAKYAGKRRYDFYEQGSQATLVFVVLLALGAVLYLYAHRRYPPEQEAFRVRGLVTLNTAGIVAVQSPEDIDWYVGEAKARPLLKEMGVRNDQLIALQNEVRELVRRIRAGLAAEDATTLSRLMAEIERGALWAQSEVQPASQPAEPSPPTSSGDRKGTGTEHGCACEKCHPEKAAAPPAAKPEAPPPACSDMLEQVQKLLSLVNELRGLQDAATGSLLALDTATADLARRFAHVDTKDADVVARLGELKDLLKAYAPPSPLSTTLSPASQRTTEQRALIQKVAGELAGLQAWLGSREDPLIRLERMLGSMQANTEGIGDLRIKLATWTRLRSEQQAAVAALKPPVRTTFFWVSPRWLVLEILAWSYFGVLTNLLLHTAETTRNGTFRRSELIVALTKLLYGPVVSFMLCAAIITQFVSYDARAWVMPIIAFLFGYNARKSANLVDWLSSKLLDRFRTAAEKEPAEVAAEHTRRQAAYLDMIQAGSVSQLRILATRLADEAALNAVRANEVRVNPVQK